MPRFASDLLQRLRLDLGLTQEAAARTLGVDVRTYRRYERGKVNEGGFEVRTAARRRFLAALSRELGVSEEEWVLEEASSPTRDRLVRAHALQPARHFVGRQDLLQELRAWSERPLGDEDLGDRDPRLVSIQGVGGAGKTAVVQEFLRRHEPSGLTFVWSFYEEPRVEAWLGALLAALGGAPGGEGGRRHRVQEALAGAPGRPLLILDGVELLQASRPTRGQFEDPELRRLLSSLAAGLGQARAILTTRLPLADLAPWEGQGLRRVPLEPLTRAEAATLLEAWGLVGGKAELERAAEGFGGHALSLALAGSYGGAFLDGDLAALPDLDLELAAADERLAARLATLLDDLARQLTPLERDLMARLSAFPHGASLACLVELASAAQPLAGALEGCEQQELQAALVRLERLGLCFPGVESPEPGQDRGRARFQAHPFVRDRFARALGNEAPALHAQEAARVAAQLSERPGALPHAGGELDRLEDLFLHLVHADRPEAALQVYLRSFGGLEHLGLRLGALTRGRRLLAHLVRGSLAWEQTWRRESRAAAAYDWGYYSAALGDLDAGEEGYRRFETILCLEADPWEAALTRALSQRALAYVAWQRGDLRSARLRIDAALRASTQVGHDAEHLRNLALSAAIAHDAGEDELADAAWRQALVLDGGRPRARRALWLAERWLARERGEEAIALLERVLPELEALGWAGHVAQAHDLLARRALATGRSVARHLQALEGWVRQSGEVEIELRWRAVAAQAAATPAEAQAHLSAGLERARACGLGLIETRLASLRDI
jgi:transcriptional regulator with XRE-family HTH domain